MSDREELRLEALKGLTILALHDAQFRRGAIEDLDGTLDRYGYDLTDPEMDRLRSAVGDEIEGWSDEEIVNHIRSGQERLEQGLNLSMAESVVGAEDFIDETWI
jgi:hypothetical protein